MIGKTNCIVSDTSLETKILDGTLTKYRIKNGVTSLAPARFENFSQLQEIDFNQVVDVPKKTCAWCTSLHKVTFSPNTKNIGDQCFLYIGNNYNRLDQDIYIPETVESIGHGAFEYAWNSGSGYIYLELPMDRQVSIGRAAFQFSGNGRLKTVKGNFLCNYSNTPESNMSQYGPFYNCPSLLTVQCDIEDPYEYGRTFYNCSNVRRTEEYPSYVNYKCMSKYTA